METGRSYTLQRFSGDAFGGVTSAVVALPMALAFGVASGLGPVAGIYGAIAVGFFAAVFGGTPAQISGPTGPMTVAMAAIVTLHADSLTNAFTIVMLAGLLQIAMGLLGIGSFVSYTPYSVISGFMSGIGIIIIALQVVPFLGADPVSGGVLSQAAAWPEAAANPDRDSLIVGTIALLMCIVWPDVLRAWLPPPLAALIVGTLASLIWFTDARVIGAIPSGLPTLQTPQLSPGFLMGIVEPALVIALLGSIDSLLTSLVADSLTRTRHNPNRELVGQGIGNCVAGAIGALPGAGATMGTVTNIRAGGRSPVAGALGAIMLLTMILGIGRVAEPIPLAVLAGILIKVGWDIIDWRFLTRMHHIRREYVLVMLTTFLLTVFIDLITAVALGLIIAGVVRSQELQQSELDSVISLPMLDLDLLPYAEDALGGIDPFHLPVGMVRLNGRFSVASSNDLVRAVTADIQEHAIVIFDFSGTTSVDDSAALAIEQLIHAAMDQGIVCIVIGLRGGVAEIMHAIMVFRRVPREWFVDGLDEAKALAKRILADGDATASARPRRGRAA